MKSTALYILVFVFVVGWWAVAFQHSSSDFNPIISPSYQIKTSELLSYLKPLQREVLKKALAGDTRLMMELISQWDGDAEVLTKRDIKHIERLSAEKLLQATIISQLIRDSSPVELHQINSHLRISSISDDCNISILSPKHHVRLLPQTDMSAGLLLAICEPQEIIALPIGIMNSPLYSRKKIKQIKSCASKLRSEQLYQLAPDIAFIASYTHPSTKEQYNNLSIQTYTTNHIDSIQNIQKSLLKFGHLSNHPLEASLLAIFIDAAFIAIDNRLCALTEKANSKSTLYLYHHHHFKVPTTKCLSGQLMCRACSKYSALKCPIANDDHHWRLPIDQEAIIKAQPSFLLLAANQSLTIEGLRDIPILLLDEYVQESPNQFIVLAYYDIYQALTTAHYL